MKDINFIIVSPLGNCGGVIVLNKLCAILSAMGYKSRIWYPGGHYTTLGESRKNNFLKPLYFLERTFLGISYYVYSRFLAMIKKRQFVDMKSIGSKYLWFPCVNSKTVVIYPEIILGDCLNSKNVVRWILYHTNAYDENPKAFCQDDMFYTYRDIFNDWKHNPTCRTLHINHYDLDLYKQSNFGERNGTCYVIRKGWSRLDLPKTFDGPIIDDFPEKKKVEMMNHCTKVVSYDTQTAYSAIAAMCGALSIVVPEPGKTRIDYRHADDSPGYGVAYGETAEEIKFANETRHLVREGILDSEKKNNDAVKKFVEEVREYFNL